MRTGIIFLMTAAVFVGGLYGSVRTVWADDDDDDRGRRGRWQENIDKQQEKQWKEWRKQQEKIEKEQRKRTEEYHKWQEKQRELARDDWGRREQYQREGFYDSQRYQRYSEPERQYGYYRGNDSYSADSGWSDPRYYRDQTRARVIEPVPHAQHQSFRLDHNGRRIEIDIPRRWTEKYLPRYQPGKWRGGDDDDDD